VGHRADDGYGDTDYECPAVEEASELHHRGDSQS
jgi:hypothetical protein